jgi:hypothetical protein
MGWQIVGTGFIMAITLFFIIGIGPKKPHYKLYEMFLAVLFIISLISIPVGLLIAIWD